MMYSFVFFLLIFVAVGLLSYRFSKNTAEDYLLASKEVKPWLAAFSIFATENSGFMFLGFVGMAYTTGFQSLWFLIGWFAGELLIWWRTTYTIRSHNDTINAPTFGRLISGWTGEDQKYVRYLCGIIIVLFLSIYAAAQLSAGSKALNVVAGWDMTYGAIIGFFMVLGYCLAGGIRATIWTDAVQAIAMLGSLLIIVGYGLYEIGGVSALFQQLHEIDPALTQMTGGAHKFGVLGFVLGWLFGGMGVLGQPHIMVRWMVLDDAKNTGKTLFYYAVFFSILAVLCFMSAFCARVLFPDLMATDPELALPTMSTEMLPPLISGFFLAGLFAAAMSTADSQMLSSSAALTQDLFPKYKNSTLWAKGGTVFVASLALAIALSGDQSVLKLVLYGWSVMASTMGPLLFLYTLGKRPSQAHAIIIMLSGATAAIGWELAGYGEDVFNVLPGIVTALAVYFIPAPFLKKPQSPEESAPQDQSQETP